MPESSLLAWRNLGTGHIADSGERHRASSQGFVGKRHASWVWGGELWFGSCGDEVREGEAGEAGWQLQKCG